MSRFKEGTVALVTGAGGGIGQAIVQRLVAEDVSVVVTDCDADALKSLADRLPPVTVSASSLAMSSTTISARSSSPALWRRSVASTCSSTMPAS
jgi:NADP-dependent 3-hydroxy acid dehydrogenase YdfG